MADGFLAGSSLTKDQLILLSLVAIVFILLLMANVSLCWLYHQVLTEDQRLVRKAQKKKMSDVWVYQVHRPAQATRRPNNDPPSQQILRKLRPSYDNQCNAVDTAQGRGTLGREESQVIEELEVTADLFLHDTASAGHSRRSSFGTHDNVIGHSNSSLTHRDNDINVLTVEDADDITKHWPFLTDDEGSNTGHHSPTLTVHRGNNCHSPNTAHRGDPGNFSSIPHDVNADFIFSHDLDVAVPNSLNSKHLSVPNDMSDSASNEIFTLNDTEVQEVHTTDNISALPDVDICAESICALPDVDICADNISALPDMDICAHNISALPGVDDCTNNISESPNVDVCATNDLNDVSFSGVTRHDFENDLPDMLGRVRVGEKKGGTWERRGSSYDNLTPLFPVAEFHNEAFQFAAEGSASVEVADDLEL